MNQQHLSEDEQLRQLCDVPKPPKRKTYTRIRKPIKSVLICTIFFCFGFYLNFAIDESKKYLENSFIRGVEVKTATSLNIQTVLPKKEDKILSTLPSFENLKKDFVFQKKSFLEVNLPDMKVRFYRDGDVVKEVNISVIGDSSEWGGTASGLYEVISKNRLAFSSVANVYMPFAINFYGKYFIHGVPYYDGGQKRVTNITGGCVQLFDTDAKEIFELVDNGTPVLVIDKYKDNYQYDANIKSLPPSVTATSFLVADLDSGTILVEKDMNKKWSIASITKLMAAVVVSEGIDLRKTINVSDHMLLKESYGGTNGLIPGKTFNLVELLKAALIQSSNDAAEVLSYFKGREKTIQSMNDKAKSLMMESTFYFDPSGISPQNVSTAKDLFYLARYISNNREPIFKITKGEKANRFGKESFYDLYNKNLFYDEVNFVGGKTGFINASKYNGIFVFNFQKNSGINRKIVIIVLGVPNLLYGDSSLKENTQKIIDWVNENYF